MERFSHFHPDDEAVRRLQETRPRLRARLSRRQFVESLERLAVEAGWERDGQRFYLPEPPERQASS